MGRQTDDWLTKLRDPRPWTEAEARRVIKAWKASGQTVSTFARRAGLVPQRLYWWRDRLSETSGTASERRVAKESDAYDTPVPSSVPAFLPVTVTSAPALLARAAVTVCMGDELRVEVAQLDGASAAWVADLVRSLAQVSS